MPQGAAPRCAGRTCGNGCGPLSHPEKARGSYGSGLRSPCTRRPLMTTQAPVTDVNSLSGESPGKSNSDKKFLFRSSRPESELAQLSHMRKDAGCGFSADHNGDGVVEGMDRLSEFEGTGEHPPTVALPDWFRGLGSVNSGPSSVLTTTSRQIFPQ